MINDILFGDQVITADTTLEGIIQGDVVVQSGATLDVGGIISGDLTIEAGASVVIRGLVRGPVENNGGNLEVYGVVTKTVFEYGGTTVIHPNARVNQTPDK